MFDVANSENNQSKALAFAKAFFVSKTEEAVGFATAFFELKKEAAVFATVFFASSLDVTLQCYTN